MMKMKLEEMWFAEGDGLRTGYRCGTIRIDLGQGYYLVEFLEPPDRFSAFTLDVRQVIHISNMTEWVFFNDGDEVETHYKETFHKGELAILTAK